MWAYERRLAHDLERWRKEGWVTDEGARQIRAEIASSWTNIGLAPALAILGVVLLGFAAMSFVAANWQEMPKFVRLGVLLGGLWGAFAVAATLLRRGQRKLADAAVLLATCLFGASIMLIAQMYHMEGNPPHAVLTWALGSLLAGVVLRSNPALALAMVLATLWTGWEKTLIRGIHWEFLPLWAVIGAAFYWQRWRPGLHLSGLALAFWVVELGYWLSEGHAHGLVTVVGLAVAGAAWATEARLRDWSEATTAVLGYGAAVAFAGLQALQFVEQPSTANLVVFAIATLALTLALVLWGTIRRHRGLVWLGYLGFSVEVLAIYFRTIASLMGSSLFFLTTGVVILGLSALAWRLHARLDTLTEVRS